MHYDPELGTLTWIKKKKKANPGDIVSCIDDGYFTLQFDGIKYPAHRLCWYSYHGSWPVGVIDHINRDKLDNRIENLRDATNRLNSQNTVRFNKGASRSGNKWKATIWYNQKLHHLGYFDTEEEAQAAYENKSKEV